MDVANIIAIPPVTRIWLGSVLVISSAISLSLVHPAKLHYLLGASSWLRIFTTFSTWGEIGFQLLLRMMFAKVTCGNIEQSYILELGMFPRRVVRSLDERKRTLLKQKFEQYKTFDFAWFLFQLAMSTIVAAHLQRYVTGTFVVPPWVMGYVLDNVLFYISGKLTPEEGIPVFIVMVKKRYAFWAFSFINYFLSDEFLTIPQMYSQWGTLQTIRFIATGPVLWCTISKSLIGHFWWFVRYYLLEDLYNESKTVSREAWQSAFDAYETRDPLKEKLKTVVGDVLRFIVLPPWYTVIVPRLIQEELVQEEPEDEEPVAEEPELIGEVQ
ncbi:hypothetical protein FT663_02947 [Candidozyma haemuli var. vulneris]|uniref:Derlin n=1 Tax=Candidozyma haemuli TaxID=45357 RepID=A0A2V1AY88_9ASCO|nr:hypothetical protein CXQ85_005351 [[Candida] haemuloni]KAF3985911.1 hypothetical protein FT662_04870 [[Candida] haemuloni var. vulneris]KAF3990981.1 hypothetical protein FT663_02947 [[Candida] haemuloni var. vulneris]PVH22323.1 hypothetical protein CXQ85_005351 [[Candida] haemuloni]